MVSNPCFIIGNAFKLLLYILETSIVYVENGKLRVCVNHKALSKITKKDRYPLPFCEEVLEEIVMHKMYTFGDGYRGYHQMKIVPQDQLKTTFTTPWGTFYYIVMPFDLCNAPGTFQRLMNKVFEPFLGLFL